MWIVAALLLLAVPCWTATLGPLVSRPALYALRLTWSGEASYYARRFHGRIQADGTLHDQGEMTCAARAGAFGDTLVVTRLDTGRSVKVVVEDRMGRDDPPERIVDLSREAARKLGILRAGWTEVNVTVRHSKARRRA